MLVLSLLFGAPILIMLNLWWHFMRVKRLDFEMICNFVGIAAMVYLLAFFSALKIPRDTYGAAQLGITLLLPFGTASYLYGKYSVSGAYRKTAMAFSVLCAAAEVFLLTILFGRDPGYGILGSAIFLVYYSLVPLNFIVTTFSEVIMRCMGADIYIGDRM